MDGDYQFKYQKMKTKKAENIIEGCEFGCSALKFSIVQMFSGILCDPCKKYKSSGIKGFFKQAFKGSVGVVTKPISGVLDYVAYTSEGITGTTEIGQYMPRKERSRDPMPVYGYFDRTDTYKTSDALTYKVLKSDLGVDNRFDKYLMCFNFYEKDL